MEYQRTVLPNGVRVLSRSAPGVFGVRLRLTYRAGAALEAAGLEGLAHLAEHMPFKGTVTRDARAIARAFERQGGEVDAYTDHHETTYLAVLPGTALGTTIEVIGEMLRRPRLEAGDLAKEQSVILEELRTYEDDPAMVAYQVAVGGLWRGWPQGRPVAGSATTVARLTTQHVRDWFDCHYGADRLVIAAAGAVEHAELVERVTSQFGDLPPVGPAQAPTPHTASDRAWASLHRREGEQVAVCLAMPAPGETDDRMPTVEALAMLLGGNDCARLFSRLRDELGLVYSIDAAVEAGPGASQIVVTTECAPESVSQVIREIESILNQMMAEPPAADELADALVALQARWLLPFDSPMSYADWLVSRELWHGHIDSPRTVASRFQAVTPAGIQMMARACLAPETRHLALVGPLARTWRPVGWHVEVKSRHSSRTRLASRTG